MSWRNGKTRGTQTLLNAAIVLVLAALSVFVFADAVTKELGHDEHMYCTAGYLTAQSRLIYRDFSYVAQLPWHPLLLALLYKISGTNHYLLAGRLLSAACDIGIMAVIIGICKSTVKQSGAWGAFYCLAAIIIYATNYFVRYASGFAWNHSITILCVLICFWIFVSTDFDRLSFGRLCGAGALATFAMFTRPTAALAYAVFAAAVICIAPGRLKKGRTTALPFILGSFVLALWPLSVIARAPRAFFLNVIRIPALNAAFLNEAGWVYSKSRLTSGALLSPCYLGLIVLGVYLAVVLFLHRRKITYTDKWKCRLCAAVTAAVVAGVFVPPTMWLQYWAMPAAFAAVLLARPFGFLCKAVAEGRMRKIYLLIAVVILALVAGTGLYDSWDEAVSDLRWSLNVERWVPVRVHAISRDIHSSLIEDGSVLTLGPLYAIEGGSGIYPQFSAGAFVYRIADRLSAAERKLVRAAGAADLEGLVRARPPAAVILGIEPQRLEKPIFDEVVGPQWHWKTYGENGPVAYFRDSKAGQAEE